VVLILAGCNQSKLRETEQKLAAAESRVTQMNELAAEKDTLMSELIATTTFINQVNDELSKIKPAKGAKAVTYNERVMPVAEYRTAMLKRVREIGKRLDDAEARLQSAQARLRTLSSNDKELTQRVAVYDSMVAQYRTMMADQRTQIETLTAQLDTLQAERTRLVFEKASLDSAVTDLTVQTNTVYFTAGTKQELLKRGVAKEEGGARVLGIFGKAGRTLVPAAELQEEDFATLDKRTALEITFPKADKPYSIVSPHSVKYVQPQPDKDGKIRGGKIVISDPQAFWEQSKFLILVER
jgi:chromosome segregation ATPase